MPVSLPLNGDLGMQGLLQSLLDLLVNDLNAGILFWFFRLYLFFACSALDLLA